MLDKIGKEFMIGIGINIIGKFILKIGIGVKDVKERSNIKK